MSKKPKDPCKANACKIQACLVENNFQESKCLDALEEMRLCCVKWQKESFVCTGINIGQSYLSGPGEQKSAKAETLAGKKE